MKDALLAFAALFCFVLLSAAVFRVARIKQVMLTLIWTSAVAFASTCFVAWWAGIGSDFWTYAAFYGCAYLAFIQLFAIFYKSVSLRVVYDICSTGKHSETKANVYQHSILNGCFERRLCGLEEGGLILILLTGAALTEKGKKAARRLRLMQRLFGITNSG